MPEKKIEEKNEQVGNNLNSNSAFDLQEVQQLAAESVIETQKEFKEIADAMRPDSTTLNQRYLF